MRNFLSILTLLFITNIYAQVGIGTTNPQQKLDVAGTNPATETVRIQSLNSTNSPTNNDGVNPANLAVNANGDIVIANTVNIISYNNEFTQTSGVSVALNPSTSGTQVYSIPGIDGQTITVPANGMYEFTFSGFFGAAEVDIANSAGAYICNGEGEFELTVNGVTAKAYVTSASYGLKTGNGAANSTNSNSYYLLARNSVIVKQIYLTAGTHTIDMKFNNFYLDGSCVSTETGSVGGQYGGSDDSRLTIHYVGQ